MGWGSLSTLIFHIIFNDGSWKCYCIASRLLDEAFHWNCILGTDIWDLNLMNLEMTGNKNITLKVKQILGAGSDARLSTGTWIFFTARKEVNFDQSGLWPTDHEGQLWRLFSCHAFPPVRRRVKPPCASRGREIGSASRSRPRSLLTARFGIFSGLVELSTWHRWLPKIERWIVREIKQHCFNAGRLADGAELDPDADATSEASELVCSALFRICPGMAAASDVALGGCEGKIGGGR